MIGDADGSVHRFNSHSHLHGHHIEGSSSFPQFSDSRLPPLQHRPLTDEVPVVTGPAYYPPSHFPSSRLAAPQYSTEPPLEPQYHPPPPQRQEYDYANSQQATSTGVVYTAAHFQPAGPAYPALVQDGSVLGNEDIVNARDPPSPTAVNARRHTAADIGSFQTFESGPFTGRTIRAEVREVQKADLGRKCADPPTAASTTSSHKAKDKDKDETRNVRKDRRPLDPPPVVKLRLVELKNRGTPEEHEVEIPPDEIEVSGLICQVDIFRVTIPPSPGEMAGMQHWAANQGYRTQPSGTVGGEFGHPVGSHAQTHGLQSPYSPYAQQHGFTYPPRPGPSRDGGAMMLESTHGHYNDVPPMTPHSATVLRGPGPPEWNEHGESPLSPMSPTSNYTFHPSGRYESGTGDQNASIDPDTLPPPTEADKLNRVLFGESFTHACNILDLNGKPTIFFVFSDLSVKLEGLFRPRYRFFDLLSRMGSRDVPILAECFGGCFAVYSTKEFPGLKRSTPLTKHLSRWGIRVNIRETERKRRTGDKKAVGDGDGDGSTPPSKRGASNKRGRSKRGTAVDSSSTTSDDRLRDGEAEERPVIPRGVDAPRRYLEDTTRGKKRTRGV